MLKSLSVFSDLKYIFSETLIHWVLGVETLHFARAPWQTWIWGHSSDTGPQGPQGACSGSGGRSAGARHGQGWACSQAGRSPGDAQAPTSLRASRESWPQGPHSVFRSHLAEGSCPCRLGHKVSSIQDYFILDVKWSHSKGTCGDRRFFSVWAQILLVLMPLYKMTH